MYSIRQMHNWPVLHLTVLCTFLVLALAAETTENQQRKVVKEWLEVCCCRGRGSCHSLFCHQHVCWADTPPRPFPILGNKIERYLSLAVANFQSLLHCMLLFLCPFHCQNWSIEGADCEGGEGRRKCDMVPHPHSGTPSLGGTWRSCCLPTHHYATGIRTYSCWLLSAVAEVLW